MAAVSRADVRRFLVPPANRPVARGAVPTFSVVIPAYQAAAYIGRAIESVLAQTVPAHEIIVSDDGSTDDLLGALVAYEDRLTIVHGPNGGLPVARNRGFGAASGEFVANLDADDVLFPEWLEAVGELAAARPDLDILTTNGYRVEKRRRIRCYPDYWGHFEVADQRSEIMRRNFIVAFAAVRRARFLEVGGFDEGIVSSWDLWLRLLLAGSRAGCVNEMLFEYTARQGSLRTAPGRSPDTKMRVLTKALSMDISDHERGEITAALTSERMRWEREMLHVELASGRPGARSRALRLAFERGHQFPKRLKMIAAAIAPRLAGHVLRSMDRVATAKMFGRSEIDREAAARVRGGQRSRTTG